jgi:hypothetical protein
LHRAVWEHVNDRTIGAHQVVMHTCDRPNCIEPSHLRLGTQRDNIHDMYQKGRQRVLRGSAQGGAKLTEEVIPAIRAMLLRGDTCKSIGDLFGVTEMMIRHIKKGRAWRHVAGYGS